MLYIFLGGGLGSVVRFLVSSKVTSGFKNINPWGIMTANILATIVLGLVLYGTAKSGALSSNMKALIITGFCGGFSTFSTFSYETFELLRSGEYWMATANVLVSVALGLAVLFIIAKSFSS